MRIHYENLALPVSAKFADAIYSLLDSYIQSNENTAIVTFRDPNYSAHKGGYHPVEIRLEKWADAWRICYITDFCFIGDSFEAELIKDLDFNFEAGNFQNRTGCYPIEVANMIYPIWEDNFMTFWKRMSVYEIRLD